MLVMNMKNYVDSTINSNKAQYRKIESKSTILQEGTENEKNIYLYKSQRENFNEQIKILINNKLYYYVYSRKYFIKLHYTNLVLCMYRINKLIQPSCITIHTILLLCKYFYYCTTITRSYYNMFICLHLSVQL